MSETQFNPSEAQNYWREHFGRRAPVDFEQDPDALNNVCYPGVPLWLNQHYARFQELVFRKLLSHVEGKGHSGERRALDVGCGAGRWCQVLEASGYRTTGVDLQESLIRRNRERFPSMQFVCGSMQEFAASTLFDLVSSVTVIQHNPVEAQHEMLRNIRRVLRPGGHVLALENVHDQDVHVFAGSISEWLSRFERAGFRSVLVQRYDYSPLLRAERAFVLQVRRLLEAPTRVLGANAARSVKDRDPGAPVRSERGRLRGAADAAHFAMLHALAKVDARIEQAMIERNIPLPTVHCGFLLEAV